MKNAKSFRLIVSVPLRCRRKKKKQNTLTDLTSLNDLRRIAVNDDGVGNKFTFCKGKFDGTWSPLPSSRWLRFMAFMSLLASFAEGGTWGGRRTDETPARRQEAPGRARSEEAQMCPSLHRSLKSSLGGVQTGEQCEEARIVCLVLVSPLLLLCPPVDVNVSGRV